MREAAFPVRLSVLGALVKQLDSVSHMYAKLATHEIICSSVSLFVRFADSCYNLEKSSDIWIFAPFSSFAFLRISSYNKRK